MEKKTIFRSRVSMLLLGFTLAIALLLPIFVIRKGVGIEASIIVIVATLFPFIIITPMLFRMRYSISKWQLDVPYYGGIEILDIISIKRSYNPLSSPAASLKRLRIDYRKNGKKGWILISPVREEEFIEMLKNVNPRIQINVSNKKGIWRIQDWDI